MVLKFHVAHDSWLIREMVILDTATASIFRKQWYHSNDKSNNLYWFISIWIRKQISQTKGEHEIMFEDFIFYIYLLSFLKRAVATLFQHLSLYKYSSYLLSLFHALRHSNSRPIKKNNWKSSLYSVLFSNSEILMKRCYFVTVNKITKSAAFIYSYSKEMNRTFANEWNIFVSIRRSSQWMSGLTVGPSTVLFMNTFPFSNAIVTYILFVICSLPVMIKKKIHHFTVPMAGVWLPL